MGTTYATASDGGVSAASGAEPGAQAAVEALGTWEPSATGGFGTGNDLFMAAPFTEYEDELYVGASNGDGAEIRVLRGGTWQTVSTAGFGDGDNDAILSLHPYGGRLYAGTFNFTAGCEVWSYDGSGWRQEVGQDPVGTPGTGPGFGNLYNCAAYSMEVHEGKLYVGTIDLYIGILPPFVGSNGGDIWCFDGAGWSQSMDGGFGDIRNIGVTSLMEYGGSLCAGTMCAEFLVDAASFPAVDLTVAARGCQLWGEGTGAWAKLAGDGFGDLDNAGVMSMETYQGKLILGILNGGITLTVDITDMDIQGLEWHSDGLSVCSYNGSAVSSVVQGGFPGIGGIGIFSMTTMEVEGDEMLLAGGGRKIEDPGAEIDASSLLMIYDGQSWGRAAEDGFGNPNNIMNMSLAVWGGEAYVGTLNTEGGCDIWRGTASPPSPAPAFYFAEGYTGAGFQEYLCLGNPGTARLQVKVTYLFRDGATPEVENYNVPAQSRLTVDVNGVVEAGKDVSIKCESDAAFVSERPMYFDYTGAGGHWTGGHDAVGASAPSQEWYFAEGYTGPGFDEYICVLNPGGDDAGLTFRFQTQGGEIVVEDKTVPAYSRETFLANALLGAAYETSLKLESTQPVVAERPMYFDYLGAGVPKHWTGGHCVMGAAGLASEYYFAEGYTGAGFEEYLTLQNPHAQEITVQASYQLGAGQGTPVRTSYAVPPEGRATVYVNAPGEVGPGREVSMRLTCSETFLAERPIYFDYTGTGNWHWTGGHCVIGAAASGDTWFFAEGYTGEGFEEWLCIQNPGGKTAELTITYYPEGGGEPIVCLQPQVAGGTRYTVYVNGEDQAGPGLSISARVVSDQPVIVERPMYFDFFGITGGHVVVGYVP